MCVCVCVCVYMHVCNFFILNLYLLTYLLIFWKNAVSQIVGGRHTIVIFHYGSQWLPSTVWLPKFLKIYFFVLNRRTKLTQILQNMRLSNCPFNNYRLTQSNLFQKI